MNYEKFIYIWHDQFIMDSRENFKTIMGRGNQSVLEQKGQTRRFKRIYKQMIEIANHHDMEVIIYEKPTEKHELLNWQNNLAKISKDLYNMILYLVATQSVITREKIKPIMKITTFQNLVNITYQNMMNLGKVILTKFPIEV